MQLCSALKRHAAAIRDNDGKEPEHWRVPIEELLENGKREVFIGQVADGPTLEPQFAKVNNDEDLRQLFDITDGDKATVDWMKAHKTDWALTLDEHPEVTVSYPGYISDAVDFVS
jgi:hypothetical protein